MAGTVTVRAAWVPGAAGAAGAGVTGEAGVLGAAACAAGAVAIAAAVAPIAVTSVRRLTAELGFGIGILFSGWHGSAGRPAMSRSMSRS